MLGNIKKGAGFSLRFLQSRAIFRAAGKKLVRGISVREASPSDLAFVQSKMNPGSPMSPALPDPAVTNLVAFRHGQVLGFVQLVRHPPAHAPYIGYWLFSLYIMQPLYRGTGIGEILTRAILDIARLEGAPEVNLVVNEINRPAIRLYQKLGFRHTSVPGLENQLEEETRNHGKRRVTMAKRFHE